MTMILKASSPKEQQRETHEERRLKSPVQHTAEVPFTKAITDVRGTPPRQGGNGDTAVAPLGRRNVTLRLKARIVQQEQQTISPQRGSKQISSATNRHAIIEEILVSVICVVRAHAIQRGPPGAWPSRLGEYQK
jgi:hypothetical protein